MLARTSGADGADGVIELAQATAPTGGAAVVARLPAACMRSDIAVAGSTALVFTLPQVANAQALRTMVVQDDLVVSSRGYGALVLDGFLTAANSAAPPMLILADGTSITAQEALVRPGSAIALQGCQPGAGGRLADALSQIVPSAGGTAQADLPADPSAAADGGRFNSSFAPSTFDGLAFGDVNPLSFGRGAGGFGGRGLLHGVREIIDLLGLGTNDAEAFIPFSQKPSYSPTGGAVDTDALIANEGSSVYLSGLAGLVGIPDSRNLSVAIDPFLIVTLEHDNAGFQSIVGFYRLDGAGNFVDIDILWLNASLDGGDAPAVAADFFGQVGDRTTSSFVPPESQLGLFMIADGGRSDGGTGPVNRALLMDLFADLGIDPTAAGYQANVDAINAHLRYNPATLRIEVETDPGIYTPLVGETYFSHDPTLNSDYRSDLSLAQNAHTLSGVEDGLLWIGFEDWPLRGDILRNPDDAIVSIGGGPGRGSDLDYNDLIFSIDILYPEVPITPAVWQPTTTIFSSLSEGLGALALASFVVGGLNGDGVTFTLDGLTAGWVLTPQADVDGYGNGTYILQPPGSSSTASAMIAELNKISIGVPGDEGLLGRPPVTVDFTVVDTLGHSESAQASLAFTQGGPSPPAPPDVQIIETYVPPPAIVTYIETTV